MQQEVHSHTFANGLTLLAEPMPHVRSAAVSFLVPAGCAHDPPEQLGLASVLADLLTRGAGDRDSRALTMALDNLGCDHGESVGSLNMSLFAASLSRDLPEVLDIYADILRRPRLPEDGVEPAKMLGLQDLQGLEDSAQQKVMLELRKRYYPDPINKHQLDTVEGVKAVTIGSVRELYERRFRPDGTIITVAGNFEWAELRDQIERLFGDWEGQAEALGDPCGEGDARGLAAGHRVEALVAGARQHMGGGIVHRRGAQPRIGDQLAAVDIDRRGEARGQLVGRVGAKMHRLHLEQHPGDIAAHHRGIGGGEVHDVSVSVMSSARQCSGKPGSNTVTGPAPVSILGGGVQAAPRVSRTRAALGATP